MRKLNFILLAFFCSLPSLLFAQEEGGAGGGQGSVSISQDQRLQNIVSGETPVVERKQEAPKTDSQAGKKRSGSTTRTSAPRKIQRTQIVDVKDLPTFGNRSNNDFDVRTGARRRLRGFRIQMFWGNSLRTDQLPLVGVVHTDGRAVYASQGYTIGTGEKIAALSRKL